MGDDCSSLACSRVWTSSSGPVEYSRYACGAACARGLDVKAVLVLANRSYLDFFLLSCFAPSLGSIDQMIDHTAGRRGPYISSAIYRAARTPTDADDDSRSCRCLHCLLRARMPALPHGCCFDRGNWRARAHASPSDGEGTIRTRPSLSFIFCMHLLHTEYMHAY